MSEEDFDDPFGFHEENDDHETPDQQTVEKEDPKDDAEDAAPEGPTEETAKSESKPTPRRRDYGRTGIASSDPADLKRVTAELKASIKKLGTYETLTCLANAFEEYGTELEGNPSTSHRGYVFHEAAELVDKIVDAFKGT